MSSHLTFKRSRPRALCAIAMFACAGLLTGCGTVSVPLSGLFGGDDDEAPIETGSIDSTATTTDEVQQPQGTAAEAAERQALSLTRGDLQAMGRQLTTALQDDPAVGTFAWTHETTGRAGHMTPFAPTAEAGNQARCRLVSVEITDRDLNRIVLADACLEDGTWVFVTPRPGEAL